MALLATLGLLSKPFEAVANTVSKAISGGQKRRSQRDAIKGRIEQAKTDGQNQVTVTENEWDSIAIQATETSWKDEYVTVLITSPFVMIFLGAVFMAFNEICDANGEDCKPDDRLLNATLSAIKALADLNVDMGWLMGLVVMAAIGIKGVRTGIRELLGR